LHAALCKEFFKKIKNRLCRRPLTGALGTGFFQKNPFADGLCQWLSAQVFLKKNKTPLCRRPLPVALGTDFFQKKIKPPLCRRPGPEAIGKEGFKKPSTYLVVNGCCFWPTAHCGLLAQAVPRASSWVLGKEPWPRKNSP
jgi:hypothetical protein